MHSITDHLDRQRSYADGFLPDTCTVHNKVYTPDGKGGGTEAPGPALATYKCRRGRARIVQRARKGVLEDVYEESMTLESATTVDVAQLITFGGVVYEVTIGAGASFQVSPVIKMVRLK